MATASAGELLPQLQRAAKGSLLVVGTGIRAVGQMTMEAESAIRDSDHVFYLVQDALTASYLKAESSRCESLAGFYGVGKPRSQSYSEMVERVLAVVRSGARVCVAFYGHPGVFSFPGHELIRRARSEGFLADMLAGVSAEACLFADLGVDPGERGCQSFEATDFLVRHRRFDPGSHLILWQVGAIGVEDFRPGDRWSTAGLVWLGQRLSAEYGAEHRVVLYEAPSYPVGEARVTEFAAGQLGGADAGAASTLYVPPLPDRDVDGDLLAELRAASK